jgi:2-aminoethylphosphonate-pyruvate transaminase
MRANQQNLIEKECELKFRISSLEKAKELINIIQDIGFYKELEHREIDFVPDTEDYLCRKAKLLLRFRGVYGIENDILLTLKIKKSREGIKLDEEVQTLFSEQTRKYKVLDKINEYLSQAGIPEIPENIFDFEDLEELIRYTRKLGFVGNRALIEKKRIQYMRENFHITIDSFPENRGVFLELEGKSVEEVEAVASQIGLDESQKVIHDYGEIIKEQKLAEGFTDAEARVCVYDYETEDNSIILGTGPNNKLEFLKSKTYIDLAHRDVEFQKIYHLTSQLVTEIITSLPGMYETLLVSGSGTNAHEAFWASLNPTKVLLFSNGHFGERLEKLLRQYHEVTVVHDTGVLNEVLESDTYSWFACVHHETSIGIVNSIKQMSQKVRSKQPGIKVFVDGVSSVGIEDVNLFEQGITVMSGVSGKAFMAGAGIAFLTAEKDVWVQENYRELYKSYSLSEIIPYHKKGMFRNTPTGSTFLDFFESLKYFRKYFYKLQSQRETQMNLIREVFGKYSIHPIAPKGKLSKANSTFIVEQEFKAKYLEKMRKNNFIVYVPAIPNAIQISTFGDINMKSIHKFTRLTERMLEKYL